MGNLAGFDANNVAPATAIEPIPAGIYPAMIAESEMKPTNSGGEMLSIVWQIVDGEHSGRKIWQNLNLQNANETAVKIAKAELSAICHATGVMTPDDSYQLHDIVCDLDVKIEKRKDNGEYRNAVKSVAKLGEGGKKSQAPAARAPATPPPANNNAAPWAKK